MFTCAQCDLRFRRPHQLSEHRRIMHQKIVSVTHGGDKQDNARYLQDHAPLCVGTGSAPKMPGLTPGTGTLVPVGDEIEFHEILRKYNLAWNVRCRILICMKCHFGVPLGQVRSHYRGENESCPFSKAEVQDDFGGYEAMMSVSNTPPDHEAGKCCAPVQGLMTYNGFTCNICQRSWPTKKTLDNHFSSSHRGRPKDRTAFMQRDKCQSFYGHSLTHYFPVTPYVPPDVAPGERLQVTETLNPGEVEDEEVINKMIDKIDQHIKVESAQGPDSAFQKEMANWVFVTGIQEYVQQLVDRGKTHAELVVVGEGHEPVEVMVRYIAAWIDKAMKRVHDTGQYLKRLCMAETRLCQHSEMEDNKGLMPLQEKTSVINYARIISTFVWFLATQAETPLDLEMQLHTSTKNKLLALKAIVGRMRLPQDQTRHEDYTGIVNNPIGDRVCDIMCSIFQVRVGGWAKQYNFPPMQFLALSMVKEDGSYRDPNLMTHLISPIQYATRLAFAEQYLNVPRRQFDPDADPMAPVEDDQSRFEYLRKNGPGPFTYMRQLMHFMTTVILSESLPDMTFWVDQSHETLEVDNKRVTMSGIRNCIQMQDKLAHSDLSKLIEGCKMPAFDVDLYKDNGN
ncbi:hypothetical protein DFH28DRAFT_918699, partial [Melampsora americana]